jgi:hypothetical protein
MRQDHAIDALGGGRAYRREVVRVVGAGIHDPGSDHVGVGAVERERRRVVCADPDDTLRIADELVH